MTRVRWFLVGLVLVIAMVWAFLHFTSQLVP